jgi:hypothetical protein
LPNDKRHSFLQLVPGLSDKVAIWPLLKLFARNNNGWAI